MNKNQFEQVDLGRVFDEHIEPHAGLGCDKNHNHGPDCAVYDDKIYRDLDHMRAELLYLRNVVKEIREKSEEALVT